MKKNTLPMLLMFLCITLPAAILAAPGDLDPSFGSGGKVTTNFNNSDSVFASVLQADGKIVVVGNAGGDFAVARYNTDGSLDSSFSGGIVITSITDFDDQANSVAIQADGKIVVVGTGNNPKRNEQQLGKSYAVRYNPDGSLDTSFGGSGIVLVSTEFVYDYGEAVVIQPDGKILIGSYGLYFHRSNEQFSVARLNSNGTPDTSFNGNGRVVTAFTLANYNQLSDMLIQPDGKIIVSGYTNNSPQGGGFRLVRINTDGSFDAGFGANGQVIYSSSGSTPKIARQADGKIVVAVLGVGLYIVRFNVNGSLDTSFGTNGTVITSYNGSLNSTSDIALQRNGKILVVGIFYRRNIPPFESDFSVIRFNPNGSLDRSFGSNGIILTRFDGSEYDIGRTLAIQPNGKIVVAGSSSVSTTSKFALVRYEGDQNVQPSFDFDGDGKADISVFRPDGGTWFIAGSQSGFFGAQFGISTDKIVPADYDGDGKTDLAVYRSGVWYLQRSTAGFTGYSFGAPDDIPQPADFDGDGKADLAVYRPSNGVWYVYNLATNQFTFAQFGASTDVPVVGDYNGDSKADYAVFRPSNGFWYIARPTGIPAQNFDSIQLGQTGDKPVPADYDGDGKTDVAVFRPSNGVWYLNRSTAGLTGVQFGIATDLPTPADYDGDGRADIAVFRSGVWYLNRTTAGFTGVQFGASTDKPTPNAFIP